MPIIYYSVTVIILITVKYVIGYILHPIYKLKILFNHCVCVYYCHSTCVDVRGHLWELVLSLHHVGPRDQP